MAVPSPFPMDADDVKLQLHRAVELLGHRYGSYVEVRKIYEDGRAFSYYKANDGFGAVMGWLEELVSLQSGCPDHHLYVSRSARSDLHGTSKYVDRVSMFSMDIDPKDPARPASDDSIQECIAAAEYICRESDLPTNILMSGNGAQIWCRLYEGIDVRGRRDFISRATQEFESLCALDVEDKFDVKVDSVFDLPRVLKVPGSLSIKGGVPRRSYWVNTSSSLLEPDRIITLGGSDDSAPQIMAGDIPSVVPDRFWQLLKVNETLMRSWSGLRNDIQDKSGSGQDCALVSCLKGLGFKPEEAILILSKSPGGKKRGNMRYWKLTVSKVYGRSL